jgi:hypothetical protein
MIFVDRKIYNYLITLKNEQCGFIYGDTVFKKIFFDKIHEVKNISKKYNEYKMKKSDVFMFILKNVFRDMQYCLYHVHNNNASLSMKDKENMMKDVPYLIVYKTALFFYLKTNGKIIDIKHSIIG